MSSDNKVIKEYMAQMGSLGGKVKGKSKRRGNKQFYRELQRKAVEARLKKAAEKK